MAHSRSLLTIAVGLALGTTAAVAAPTAVPSGGTPVAECPTPGEAECVAKGYLDSKCGQRHLAICKPFALAAMEAHHDGTPAPSVKMLRPKQTQMPLHVKLGKYFAYEPRLTVKKKGADLAVRKVYRKSGDVLAGASGMSMADSPPVDRVTTVDPVEAAKFHRNPAWEANGRAVRSCKEYAYARNHGATRFIDAASACRGDRECVFAVAYMPSQPGIARRKLRDEDGVQMSQLDLPVGKFPKNDLFVPKADEFVRADGVTKLEPDDQMLALEKALRDGEKFYDIGSCSGGSCNNTRKFHDVWDWHEQLHTSNASVSQAEAEEYERRRAEFRGLLERWAAAVAKEHAELMHEEQQAVVLPFDMRAYDPFERFELERTYIERGRDQLQKIKKRFGEEIVNQPLSEAVRQLHGMGPGLGGSTMGLFAAPAPPKAAGTGPGPVGKQPAGAGPAKAGKKSSSLSRCLRASGWGLEMNLAGPLSCRIGEFYRTEWARKVAGQRSCLDLGDPGCDWTPQMFEAGILDQIPKLDRQLADEAYCTAYLDTDTFADGPGSAVAQVTLVKNRLDATKAQLEKELTAVGEYLRPRNGVGRRLGKDWEGGDYVGDKDWFAAGYEYGVGWEVAPAAKDGDGLVCELAGSAHGEMGFDAWIIGNKIPVVDGAVRAEAKRVPPNSGEARFNAHLEMMGQSLFNTDGWKSAQTFVPEPDAGFGVTVPSGIKPRFDIYVGVPISGELWGELLFGSSLKLAGRASTECKANNPRFDITATYTPYFAAYGVGQVGVGIAGVASAGIRATLTLIQLGLPADLGMHAAMKKGKPTVSFASELGLSLATLAGRVSLYIEFLMFDEEFELFRWKGFSTRVPLMPRLTADVTLVGLK